MAFEIGLWSSGELTQYCDSNYNNFWEAAENARDHIEISASDLGKNVNVTIKQASIYCPIEDHNTSFNAPWPCDKTFTLHYDHLLDWWRDYTDCNNSNLEKDANLLLTSTMHHSGGIAGMGQNQGIARTGQDCAGASPVKECEHHTLEWGGISTAMHEIGHNLMPGGSMSINDHHSTGNYDGHSANGFLKFCVTPMSAGAQDLIYPDNFCNNSVPVDDTVSDVSLLWSNCCGDNWEEK